MSICKHSSQKKNGTAAFVPVTNPALVAHWPLAVAAVDVQGCRCLVQAGDGAARTQLDDLIGHVPQLESLQQVYVGHVPVLLKWKHNLLRVFHLVCSGLLNCNVVTEF